MQGLLKIKEIGDNMSISALQKARYEYQPKLPAVLKNS